MRQRVEALLHPFIVGPVLGARRVHFMQFDRLLLEGKSLFLEQYVVLLQFVFVQISRPLRTHQVLAQLTIQLGALEGRRRRDVGHLVVGRLLVGLERSFHGLAFLGQRFLERHHEFDALEFLAQRGRQCQGGLRRQGPAAIGARRARGAIRGNDVLQPIIPSRRIAGFFRDQAQFVARLHRRIQRLRKMLDEGLEHRARLRRVARFVVQIRCLQSGFTLHVRRFARRLGNSFELRGRLPGMIRFRVGHGKIARDIGLQRTLRKIAAKPLQHHHRPIPLLVLDEQRRRIEIRTRPSLRGGRQGRHAQEIIHRGRIVAGLALLFALLIDRCRQALDYHRALGVVGGHQSLRVGIGGLRLVEHALIEVRIADHRPCDALLGGVHGGLARQQRLGRRDRPRIILGRIQIRGGPRQHLRALRMLREGLREFQRAVDTAAVNDGLGLAAQTLFLLAVGDDRSIARCRGFLMFAIVISRALVFLRRLLVLLALEQGVGEQEIGDGRIRIIREGSQIAVVPLRRFLIVRHVLGALRLSVVVLRDVLEIGLQFGHDFGFVLDVSTLPVRRAEAVILHELLLALQHELGKAALLVGLDRLHLEQRRLLVVAVLRNEGSVTVGRVRVAFLLYVEIPQAPIQEI